MSKYVIKNCPAYNDMPNMYNEIYGYCDNEHDIDLDKCMCENITDCVMKQIVEKCKNTQFLSTKNRHDLYAVQVFANDILQLLDIQEVE